MPPHYGLWSRLQGFDPHELGRMLNDREIVRLTLMRGTVHLVTVRDGLLLRPLVQPVIERATTGSSAGGWAAPIPGSWRRPSESCSSAAP